jgi:hypothetical protein
VIIESELNGSEDPGDNTATAIPLEAVLAIVVVAGILIVAGVIVGAFLVFPAPPPPPPPLPTLLNHHYRWAPLDVHVAWHCCCLSRGIAASR